MTVEENLRLGAFLRGNADLGADLDQAYERFPSWAGGAARRPGCFPAANSRCWPSPGLSCATPGS